ncbi:Phosphoenolpyruvate-protein phosphotransferase [Clavibacter michiganensis subsp. michiganensis]|uniref:Phosphoenolpyruvate-protein phosphotransferase n=1 Tax=Clavibacter michiganensis subsp. michiganensis TaxID=33013 RepID=A0A251XD71_CLAMM|nr:Phosphoenolpyruvate-protein phosphotransferase [Clavibacter michiganensis subsp. michiganensis]OUE00057.1 Phosphoenolpyruvate-protein phosphotransferase [Clavibacter michiganensis subsp. michiganensis]
MATGPVMRMPDPLPEPGTEAFTGDADAEVARVADALSATADDLAARGARAGGDAKDVLDAQSLMARDPALLDSVGRLVGQGRSGERAVFEAFATFQELLTGMGGYMAERAADLADVAQRVIARLRGVPAPGIPTADAPFVLVARDLAPADTALLELDRVLALVTTDGGPTSHTAILARSRSIPAIVGATGAADLAEGDEVVVDAAAGLVIADPSDAEREDAVRRIRAREEALAAPITDGALADGTPVPLLANLGSPAEAARAVELGAEGVGLFRTEFLFLDAAEAPSVAAQTVQYTALLEVFPGRKVVVRALDAGADKPLAFLTDADEENPRWASGASARCGRTSRSSATSSPPSRPRTRPPTPTSGSWRPWSPTRRRPRTSWRSAASSASARSASWPRCHRSRSSPTRSSRSPTS